MRGRKPVYDAVKIEELDEFAAEDCGSNADEIAANEVNITSWLSPAPTPARGLNVSGTRKRKQQTGKVVHMLHRRRQPRRSCRVKNENKYSDEEEETEESKEIDCETMDETERVGPSRVFVKNTGGDMHFEWPIWSNAAIQLQNAATIIGSEASEVDSEKVCETIPQEFTNTGTFVVRLASDKDEIWSDGLGSWNLVESSTHYFNFGQLYQTPSTSSPDDSRSVEVLFEKFVHPGTDDRGEFIRRLFTGYDSEHRQMSHGVVSYEWIGEPHPIDVTAAPEPLGTFPKKSDKDEKGMHELPVLSWEMLDFDTAVSLLLSFDEKLTTYGREVPQGVREAVSFALDLSECGGERALQVDGNFWQRPSGANRYYWLAGQGKKRRLRRATTEDFDVQVTCRRYMGQQETVSQELIRKIYVVRYSEHTSHHLPLPNEHLILLTYGFRRPTVTVLLQSEKLVLPIPTGGVRLIEQEPPAIGVGYEDQEEENSKEIKDLKKRISVMKLENYDRIEYLVERAQEVIKKLKEENTPKSLQKVGELEQGILIGQSLRSAISTFD
ncbi:unnamed protein product [Caenorhabditis auriculariae]|uniref:Uncharacterized protein n=1 Tax=Caenorhabditis auriculariae TaxID=2777116 RepID=A0A8S1HN17_9PELO|nr:unnamed protein product [Caenorhabditis auriculariae]